MSFSLRFSASVFLLAGFAVIGNGQAAKTDAGVPLQNTVIDSDTLDSQSTDTETTTYCTGHVVVTGNDIRMTCDNLKTITMRSGDKSDTIGQQNTFKYLLATGHVHIIQGDREATCGRAEVLPLDNKITLTEDPVVTDHGNNTVSTGDKMILLRGERRAIVEGHVHITAPPVKDLGFDKNQPPPAPPPAEPAKQP